MDYYPLSDLLYRSVALTDDDKDIQEAYDTDAYGNTLVFSAPGGEGWFSNADQTTDNPTCTFVFTGRRFDPETDIYFYRARYYHADLGRFLSRDPIGHVDGMGLYEYVGSDPIRHLDFRGFLKIQNVGSSPQFTNNKAFWAVAVFPTGNELDVLSKANGGCLKVKLMVETEVRNTATGQLVFTGKQPLVFYIPINMKDGTLAPRGPLQRDLGPQRMSKPGNENEPGDMAYKYIGPINNEVPACTAGYFKAKVTVELGLGLGKDYDPEGGSRDAGLFQPPKSPLGGYELDHNWGTQTNPALEDINDEFLRGKKISSGWAEAVIQWHNNTPVKVESKGSENFDDNGGKVGPSRLGRPTGRHSQREL